MALVPDMMTIEDYTEEAVRFIQRYEPPEGYFLAFSGGKDSTVIYHLAKMAGVKFQAYFTNTSIEAPETIRYVRQHPDVLILNAGISFFKGIEKWGLPFRNRRWCCKQLKEAPAKDVPLAHRIFGIRKEESISRSLYNRVAKRGRLTHYYPIIEWKEWVVWDFIEKYNIGYNSLYDEGFSRVGCMICPFFSKGKFAKHQSKFKKFYDIFYSKLPLYLRESDVSVMTKEEYLAWPLWDFKKIYKNKRQRSLFE